jgi:hypothetical protein
MRSREPVVAILTVLLSLGAFAGVALGEDGPEWKVLIYLDADNDLDMEAGLQHEDIYQIDMDELMTVGSTDHIDVFVLADRFEGPANVFKVYKGYTEEMTGCELNGVEVNMGHPDTLEKFVAFTESVSTAPNTCLFFWDHGSPTGVAWDDNVLESTEGDWLTHWEVVEALKSHDMDVIATDECSTGQVEVAYEYHTGLPGLQYAVLSECYTGWRGFPYDLILADLDRDDVTPRELTQIILDVTYEYFLDPPFMSELVTSHTGVDMAAMDGLATALTTLAGELKKDIASDHDMIISAASRANIIWGSKTMGFVDTEKFIDAISERSKSSATKEACTAVLTSLSSVVIGVAGSHVSDSKQTGLGIYVPWRAIEAVDEDTSYEDYAFSGLGWLDFLRAYWVWTGA